MNQSCSEIVTHIHVRVSGFFLGVNCPMRVLVLFVTKSSPESINIWSRHKILIPVAYMYMYLHRQSEYLNAVYKSCSCHGSKKELAYLCIH